MEEYHITYEYIDNIDPADTPDKIETYTDVVRKDHYKEFLEEGKIRSPDHFKVIKKKRYYGDEKFLPWNLGSGFNISVPNKYYMREKERLYEAMEEYIDDERGTQKSRDIMESMMKQMDKKFVLSAKQRALIDKLLG